MLSNSQIVPQTTCNYFRTCVPMSEYTHILNRSNIIEKEYHKATSDCSRLFQEITLLKYNIQKREWNGDLPKGTLHQLLEENIIEKLDKISIT